MQAAPRPAAPPLDRRRQDPGPGDARRVRAARAQAQRGSGGGRSSLPPPCWRWASGRCGIRSRPGSGRGGSTARSAGASTSRTSCSGSGSDTRDADLGGAALVPAEVAHLDQPLGRGDDDLRRHLRRPLSRDPHGAAVARLLGLPVPELPRSAVDQLAFGAPVGRLRDRDVLHDLAGLLVRGTHPRPGDDARPCARDCARRSSASSASVGTVRRARGRATRWPASCSPSLRHAAGRLGPQCRQHRLRDLHRARLAHDGAAAVLRHRRRVLRASRWC